MHEPAGDAKRDTEQIRQDIEATKERINESVEALAEVKSDIDYAKAHPKEVIIDKVVAAKDELVDRLHDKKQELGAKRAAAQDPSDSGAITKVKSKVTAAYGTIESKLDDWLDVREPGGPSHKR